MRPLVLFFASHLACALSAQTTHLVGPAGLPQIRSALAVAAPGDIVHVQPGNYAHFTANVGVTIRALTPGTVTVAYDPTFATAGCLTSVSCAMWEGPTVVQPPPGQAVHMIGLEFVATVINAATVIRHRVEVRSGTATFDACVLNATDVDALTVSNSTVHLQGCSIGGVGTTWTGHGLLATSSKVTAIDCIVTGSTTGSQAPPGDAIRLRGTWMQASGLALGGGSSTTGGVGGNALNLDSACTVWIRDSFLTASGGACAVVPGGASGRMSQCTVSPTTPNCQNLPNGLVLGVQRLTPPQLGTLFRLNFQTDPFLFLVVFANSGLGNGTVPGLLDQPVSLSMVNVWSAGVFQAGANGTIAASWWLPTGAAYIDMPMWVQAVCGPAPMQVSPVTGGILR